MNKGFEELNKVGIKGIVAFWFRLLLFCLLVGVAVFSIYWIAVTSNKIWISSIGAAILTTNVFLALTSIASFVFLLLCRLNIQIIYSVEFTHHVFAVFSFIGQVICCILMSLSNSSHAETYLKSIEDFCHRNPLNKDVVRFISNNPSNYSRFKYVAKRSTDLYSSISAFFGIWLSSTIIYILCSNGISEIPPEKLSLLNNQQEQPHTDPEQNQGNSGQEPVQPWVQNAGEESDDNNDNGQGEINITTNSYQNTNLNESQRSNQNEMQNPSQSNANWVLPPENETSNNVNNPEWVTSQGGGQPLDQNYESYTYEEDI
ncbi:hypothetical protein M9Y10_041351 [Tritrichomonas musculus]|uniref:Tetraspanin family protein n=1 Tax=Tritrichomonas musculus TaxID=1915356 RepID=A0ABR2K4B9_9EUKA